MGCSVTWMPVGVRTHHGNFYCSLCMHITVCSRPTLLELPQHSSEKPLDSAVVHSSKPKDQSLASADNFWCHPRGGNLFKISRSCWLLIFWIIRGMIIMVRRSSNYPQRIQLSSKHQSVEFRCSWEVKLCNSIILVVHVCKQWPIERHVSRWKTAQTNTPVSTFR